MIQGMCRGRFSIAVDLAGSIRSNAPRIRALKVSCVMRCCNCALMTKRSKIYDDAAMVVTHDLGYISRSDYDCSRSCRVHITECARNPSSESALGHEMLRCALNDKKGRKSTLMLRCLYVI